MLEEVRITGLGVIEDAVLEFSSGFTVVTGETGAGKTMVVTGLGLMFGGRSDPARVRPGADRATVDGRLRVDADGPAARQVLDAGGELDDDGRTLIVSRSVSAEGRSRAHAGGRAVPVSLLIGLADDLVAVHGQADQQQLLRAARQRQALDEYAGPALSAVMADYQRAYTRHREVQAELTELTTRARERAAEAEDLRRALDEIERVEPVAGEDTALLAEEERLGNADALHAAATTAHGALLGDPSDGSYQGSDAVTLLGIARQALDGVAAHDPGLGSLAGQCEGHLRVLVVVCADLAAVGAEQADHLVVEQQRGADPAVDMPAALRRHEMPFAPMRKGKRALDVVQHLVFLDLAEAAAPGAGAAGIGPETPSIDANRRLELHGLGRQVHAIRGIRLDDIDAVSAGAGAAAAGDQLADDVAVAVATAAAEGDDQELARGRCRYALRQVRYKTERFGTFKRSAISRSLAAMSQNVSECHSKKRY